MKLKSVIGFRPSSAEEEAIAAAEMATGKTRSDLLRACFALALKHVVESILSERAAHVRAFQAATVAVHKAALHPVPPARSALRRKTAP